LCIKYGDFYFQIENLQEQLRDKDKQLTNLKDRVKSLMIGPGQNRYGESDLLFELPSLLSTGFRRALNGIPGIQ